MKKTFLILTLIVATAIAMAARNDKNRINLAYDVNYEMMFDNREFYKSRFSRSMTIFGSRLTPSLGVQVIQPDKTTHKVMAGIDILRNFGASPITSSVAAQGSPETSEKLNHQALFKEMTLWYYMKKSDRKKSFEMYAGIFPRRFMEGSYSEVFFSDSLAFYDNNLEGLLMKYRKKDAYVELGCDWMGQYGDSRREKFIVYSSGAKALDKTIQIGYSAYMYHFACSREVVGVVDNILMNPYVRIDLSSPTRHNILTITLGWLQAFQHDRLNVGHYIYPCGGELTVNARHKNIGIRNYTFYGTDMMPYYNSKDIGGYKYGSRLYMGDPFFRIHDDGSSGPGFYDRLEFYYIAKPGRLLNIKVSGTFHFHKRYSGCQQLVSLLFDLDEIIR